MLQDNEKLSTGIRNEESVNPILPAGHVEPIHKTKEDIRPLPEEAKPEQEKKSDTHYVGESSKGVKKTDMSHVNDENEPQKNPEHEPEQNEELIEKTTWEIPQPKKDKTDYPL